MTSTIRILHASDFHLGEPLAGAAQFPESWRDAAVEAAYRSVQRFFETAVLEEVSLVVLSGNILDPRHCGARALAFLWEQFELLAEHRIPVSWALGRTDHPRHWSEPLKWPGEVRIFSDDTIECQFVETTAGRLTVLGRSWAGREVWQAGQFDGHRGSGPVIAAAHGGMKDGRATQAADYWALGGRWRYQQVSSVPAVVYPGTPQGRVPQHVEASGAVLLSLDDSGKVTTRFCPLDEVRWQTVEVELAPGESIQQVLDWLRQRALTLAEESDRPLLVTWRLATSDPAWTWDRCQWLAEQVNRKFAGRVWTVGVETVELSRVAAEWHEEDTLRGDFLRTLEEAERDGMDRLPVEDYAARHALPQELADVLKLTDRAQRREVLRQVSALGVRRLSGEA